MGHLSGRKNLPPNPQPPFSGSERRKETRYAISEPAIITVSQPAEFRPIEGQLVDISKSGIRIRSPRAIHRGANLHVQLKHMVVFGRARYCRKTPAPDAFEIGLAIDQVVIAPGASQENPGKENPGPATGQTQQLAPPNLEVLLVEDNPGDVRLTELMLENTGIPHRLTVVMDGEQALKRLFDSAEPKPGLMLLDLNLPKIGGLRVLECLRQDHAFDSVPVAVLSSSSAETEKRRSHELGVLAYFEKPMDCVHMRDLSTQVKALMTNLVH
ncbi:MAG TPA: response regulator [Bryobacteraceae bacterium]|nr:response regulator [Bryobacteraceae bacterium]